MLRWIAVLLAATCLLLSGAMPAAAKPRAPLVLAAASLQESLEAAADAWARKGHPRPVISFAGSSALARQIDSGAPADMFISADEQWMDYLAAKKLLRPRTRVSFLTNSLVLVAPAGSKVRLTVGRGFPLARALGKGRLAMADPDAVPAGRYGKQALTRLGVWSSVEARVARAENVRAAQAFVARGEAPLGIVYATDARAEKGVRVVDSFPAASHARISYPVALMASSTNGEAEEFRRYLLSAQGKALFRRFGFGTR